MWKEPGVLFYHKARDIADAALRWCEGFGVVVPEDDLVRKISMCATAGKHKSNCERDLRRVLEQSSTSLGVPLHDIPVRLWSHKDGNEYWGTLPVMWPDELAAAIYCFAPFEPAAFWGHCEKYCSWFASHPARNINDKSKLIPFCFYGDEINAFRNVENGSICVLGFGSDLASGNPALEQCYKQHFR